MSKVRADLERELLGSEKDMVSAQLEVLYAIQQQRGPPGNFTSWWKGYAPDKRRHEKSMHLADRLLRSFPGILMSESEHAMAVYRRVSANELILDNWS